MDSEDRIKTADFDYHLPPELIAQEPLPERDRSRLLILDRATNQVNHRNFKDMTQYIKSGDVLVLNELLQRYYRGA